jgi:hypothetical protein
MDGVVQVEQLCTTSHPAPTMEALIADISVISCPLETACELWRPDWDMWM